MKFKIIEIEYSKETLETYLNKTGFSFLGFIGDKMIFKYQEKTSREIKAKTDTERFFELNDMQLDDYSYKIALKLGLDTKYVLDELKNFIAYRTEKSEGAIKCKWQKQTSFEVPLRLKTWFSNKKNKKPVNLEINMI